MGGHDGIFKEYEVGYKLMGKSSQFSLLFWGKIFNNSPYIANCLEEYTVVYSIRVSLFLRGTSVGTGVKNTD